MLQASGEEGVGVDGAYSAAGAESEARRKETSASVEYRLDWFEMWRWARVFLRSFKK